MSSLPVPQYSLWQAVSASLAAALRAIEEVRALSRQPGPQGERGDRGPVGLGFDDIEQFEDERSFGFDLRRGDQVKELRWLKPTLADCDRGVWKDGSYVKGDGVTFGGSFWIAQRDTTGKPELSRDWRLAVKRGRDGKDGKSGERGERGIKGDPGIDRR